MFTFDCLYLSSNFEFFLYHFHTNFPLKTEVYALLKNLLLCKTMLCRIYPHMCDLLQHLVQRGQIES